MILKGDNLKVEEYMYDEGYGCGLKKYKEQGITVDEAIEELKKMSKKGFGNRFLYDGVVNEPMMYIGIKTISHRDEKLPYIE